MKIITSFIGLSTFFITLILFFTFYPETKTSPTESDLQTTCKPLILNSPPNSATKFVLFSDEKNAKFYADYLLDTEPFKKNKGAINIYLIEEKPACKLYKDIALYCYSQDAIKKAGACPHDYIIIFDKKESKIRSSAYRNLISLNTALPKSVLIHEVGHLFGLDEEYVAGYTPHNSLNCKKSCSDFKEEIDGCFTECSNSYYKRSIENGIMRTLYPQNEKNPYGKHNEEIISTKLNKKTPVQFTGFFVENNLPCNEQKYFLIEADIVEGGILFSDAKIERGCYAILEEGDYKYKIQSSENTFDLEGRFDIGRIFTDGVENKDLYGETFTPQTIILTLPFVENTRSIMFYDSNNVFIGKSEVITKRNNKLCIA